MRDVSPSLTAPDPLWLPSMVASRQAVLLGFTSFAWLWLIGACGHQDDPAVDLERRILAPCCYRQPLSDHESPLARELRAEIERRIHDGETPDRIEASLVRRYGENIRVDPPSGWTLGFTLAAVIIAGMLVMIRIARNRRRRDTRPAAPSPSDAPTAEAELAYVDRLDDELAEVD